MMTDSFSTLRQQIETELTGNLLPFWMKHTVDRTNGGFYGALTNDLQVLNAVPRSAVLCARILWTYSAAYTHFKNPEYLEMADHAYQYLINAFWDSEYGGVYWLIDAQGKPVDPHKQMYAQAFAIYGLAEYYAATGLMESLNRARKLFGLVEKYGAEPVYGGYIEARSRDWSEFENQRLSEKEPNAPKTMNTLLHIMEAYTRLYSIWPDESLKSALSQLVEVILTRVVNLERGAFNLFFDNNWTSHSDEISYGHDIEGCWLLLEAAKILKDEALFARSRKAALRMAEAVLTNGRDLDGSIFYEASPAGLLNSEKHWWVQSEAMLGFYAMYQISNDERFLNAAHQAWGYIRDHFVDHQYGEWYKILDRSGLPNREHYKTGPWECPYHNSRACMEMLERLPLK
jgi:cellobiose epimerase